ncbi:hypothetical protein [Actinomycetospora straminea]|uniref:Uncharacterized protein n=1 Tax=Actinomycetospora straminea TaxID=663607 RepID=A0ABP9E8D7_9PSEU|nr:hypothetical protein [Actinomycetospora straminea]MDD7931928.1 hypothetical protein [Actinomycetospora straminea]
MPELGHPGDVDDIDTPPVGVPTLSGWLRDRDVVELAGVARDARLVGGSFGRHLRERT